MDLAVLREALPRMIRQIHRPRVYRHQEIERLLNVGGPRGVPASLPAAPAATALRQDPALRFFLSNGQRQRRLAQARALWHAPVAVPEPALPSAAVPPTATGDHRPRCPHCGADALVLVEILYPPKTLRPEDTS